MSDPRWPDDGPNWPEHDLRQSDGEESSGTDATPPFGDEPEPPPDPPAPTEPPADRPWDEPRWDEPRWDKPRWDDSPWQEPRWTDAQPNEPQPDEPRWTDAKSDEPEPDEPRWTDAQPDEPRWTDAKSDEPEPDEPRWTDAQPDEPDEPDEPEEPEPSEEVEEGAAPPDEPTWWRQPTHVVPSGEGEWASDLPRDEAWPADTTDDVHAPDAQARGDGEPEHPSAEPEPQHEPEPPAEPEPQHEPEPQDEGPILASAEATTAFGGGIDSGWDPRYDGERRRPTTAEQAVPWMIGVILALAGMVIVLLALIFTFPGGLSADSSPSPTISPQPSQPASSGVAAASVEPSPSAEASPATPEPTEGPTPTPVPEYGPLEMVYLGRPSALAPVQLLDRDFSVDTNPTILAQANQGITRFAWSPDGRVGAGIIGGRAVALVPGASARALADDISALTFGWDSDTVYAVRITRDGANDRTQVLEIDFVSAAVQTLATITYPHPLTAPDPALREAQFIDNGGLVRLYPVADGNLTLWVLGAPAIYRLDPGDGRVSNLSREPILWAPDGRRRITLNENANGTTLIALRDSSGDATATVQVTGLVSHIRWAGSNNEIVFTLGRLGSSGGVRQDLYVWDLADGKAPMPLTSNGVSFGAEWRGVAPNWIP